MKVEIDSETADVLVRGVLIAAYAYSPDDMREPLSAVIEYYSNPEQVKMWRIQKWELDGAGRTGD